MSNKRLRALKEMTHDELKAQVGLLEHGLFEARVKKSMNELTDTALLWRLRKDLARVKTLLCQIQSNALRQKNEG